MLPTSLLANYALAGKASLQVFLSEPDVAIDTNHLERGLRVIPTGKKILAVLMDGNRRRAGRRDAEPARHLHEGNGVRLE